MKLGRSGNVTVLERPVRISTLLSAVNAAVRARRRQYETRDLLMRLEEAGRRKDEFLAMLGHELRNPLSAIRNALHVLERVDHDHPAADRQMGVLDRQSRHLTRMVEDLLDVSRVTMGKVTLQLQQVDLREIAERVCAALKPLADEHRHRFDCRTPNHPVMVEADPVRLEQILTNLLHNAVKYTPPGGEVGTELSCTRHEAVVRVRDNGMGISREMLAGIFDLFTQAEVSLARSEGGLGLGLTLVKNLVEMHHGTVSAESDGLGKGSVFEVRFPLLQVCDRQAQEPVRNESAPRLHRHVLLVEDNDDGRETLKELLELWGHNVDVACDGEEGLEQARKLHPEVMLVDIGLPRLDGFEVARRIRADFNGDRPALIAMTGYGQPSDCDRALEAGFDVFLVKPVDPLELAQQVASVTTEQEEAAPAGSPGRHSEARP
jgi:signal transduction histidine kinase/ActR/RegA family two-component response regulator